MAGLSVVSTIALISGGHMHFLVGPGITRIVDVVARETVATMPALVINMMVAGYLC